MCIILLTTSHPSYSLVLLSNRDEYLSRPTADAAWWSLSRHDIPSSDAAVHQAEGREGLASEQEVLSGRDLRHPSHGTWLGITASGRIAALTNFRDGDESEVRKPRMQDPVDHISASTSTTVKQATGNRSRGEITKDYLTSQLGPEEWAKAFLEAQRRGEWGDMGGFTLLFGVVCRGEEGAKVRLASLSNRTSHAEEVTWLVIGPGGGHEGGERGNAGQAVSTEGVSHAYACALSNTNLADKSWDKVKLGEEALKSLVTGTDPGKQPGTLAVDDRKELVRQGFEILSRDTMPPKREDEGWASYSRQLRKSILIPPIQAGEDVYGTQKQTLVLVKREGGPSESIG